MQATFSTTMTCGGCLSKVKPYLDDNVDIKSWEADLQDPRKLLRFELAEHTQTDAIASLIGQAGFTATQIDETPKSAHFQEESVTKPRFEFSTYKPLFLVVSYVFGASALFELSQPSWELARFMNNFMGFFFLGFAFFKLLNISKFADAFATYDIVARRSRAYALAYPWIELSLGLLFVTRALPVLANILTAVIMSVGLIGVIAAVRKKRTIQCACLGTAFNLPMSVVTIIENSVMLVMALAMLLA
jgi:cation transport ATPase